MDFRTITDKNSRQFELVNNAIIEDGLLYLDGYVCAALGSYFGEIGTIYRVTLANGNTFEVIKADEKSDTHTVNGCYIASNLNVIEFIVDTRTLDGKALTSGDMSTLKAFNGEVVKMEKRN